MNIGIIGAGHIGATLAKLLAKAGHQVALSTSRGPETLEELVAELGSNVEAMTAEDAARHGELVIEAIPFGRYRDLAGKTLVSASNYYPRRDGEIDFGGHTQTGLLASSLPGTKVVKAFNTIYWEHLRDQGDGSKPVEERRVIFLAGDDEDAKQKVAVLITELGFGALDTGTLAESSRQEPGSAIYNEVMTVAEARRQLAQP